MSDRKAVSRRTFLNTSVAVTSAVALSGSRAQAARPQSQPEKFVNPPDEKVDVRVGIIGTGGRGTGVMEGFYKVPGVRITALCDINKPRLEAAATQVADDKPSLFDDYRKLIDYPELDAIAVETPCYLHREMGIAVLESGRHLYAEKPMAITVAEANAIHAAARKAKGIYQIGTQLRYADPWQTAIRMIHEGGIIGDVVFIRAHRHNIQDLPHESTWFFKRELSGDTIVEQAVHEFDLMNQVMGGVPVRAAGFGGQNVKFDPPGRDIRDHYGLELDYGQGRVVSYSHSWIAPPHVPCDGRRELVYGSKGAIDLETGQLYLQGSERPKTIEFKKTSDATLAAVRDFVRCIRERDRPFADVEAGRDALLVALLGRKALDEGRVVTMTELLAEG
ncbi:MAG: Gfo/Idh/MocA family oxidoreductase [Planctomycetes bacterium]|nr:Gfo/Idh/MocA family oxidoreductase [Planctomycetota bacterium]